MVRLLNLLLSGFLAGFCLLKLLLSKFLAIFGMVLLPIYAFGALYVLNRENRKNYETFRYKTMLIVTFLFGHALLKTSRLYAALRQCQKGKEY